MLVEEAEADDVAGGECEGSFGSVGGDEAVMDDLRGVTVCAGGEHEVVADVDIGDGEVAVGIGVGIVVSGRGRRRKSLGRRRRWRWGCRRCL